MDQKEFEAILESCSRELFRHPAGGNASTAPNLHGVLARPEAEREEITLLALRALGLESDNWRAGRLLDHVLPTMRQLPEGIWFEVFSVQSQRRYPFNNFPLAGLVGWLELMGSPANLPMDVLLQMRSRRDALAGRDTDKGRRALVRRLDIALGLISDHPIPKPVDAWTAAALRYRDSMPEDERMYLDELLRLASTAKGSTPSRKYCAEGQALVEKIPSFVGFMRAALGALGYEGPVSVKFRGYDSNRKDLIDEDASDLLRSLIWLCEPFTELTQALRDASERCFEKHRNIGALNAKLGSACVLILGRQSTPESTQAIGEASRAAEHVTTKRSVAKAQEEVAKRTGERWDAIEVKSAPRFGLDSAGSFSESFGEHMATLRWSPAGVPQVVWTHGSSRRAAKTIPAAVRESFALELEALRERIQELKKAVKAQARTLERLMIEGATFPVEFWLEHFVGHPLVGRLARQLVWNWDSVAVASFASGEGDVASWRTLDGEIVEPAAAAIVSAWHPAAVSCGEVERWEKVILDFRIQQPFQQVARAAFRVEDGVERPSGGESVRFKERHLQEGVFAALCRERGWRYQFHAGPFHREPSRVFGPQGIRAVLGLAAGDKGDPSIAKIVSARFCRRKGSEGMALSEVPSIVYSEAMRDISLFVERAGA